MDKRYNLDNLEALFKKYLVAGIERTRIKKKNLKPTSIKNYLSDLRHFLGWLIFYLRSHNQLNQTLPKNQLDIEIEMVKKIDSKIIGAYKTYLWENNLPMKTINRRLSTLRKFFSFCISQDWLRENPAKRIQNLNKNDQLELEKEKIFTQFKADLLKEDLSQEEINSYLKDVEEFLSII